jgi:adenylate cyclase
VRGAEPGGICLSGEAYDQIKRRISVACRFMGEQSLKNILEPVRVYAIDRMT